jgi:arabinose-5-phosphate isomerase
LANNGNDVTIVSSNTQLLDTFLIMSQKALGMVLITHGKTLQGIFTDGDLRRVLETHSNIQNLTIGEVMTLNCKSILANEPAMAAVAIMDEFNVPYLRLFDSLLAMHPVVWYWRWR